MEFLEQNYIWIIVVGVFILMIIVGYLADKKQNATNKKQVLKDHVDELDNDEENNQANIEEWGDKPVKKEEDEIVESEGLDNSFDSWDENMNAPLDEDTSEENGEDSLEIVEQSEVEESEISDTEELTNNVENSDLDSNETKIEDDFVTENDNNINNNNEESNNNESDETVSEINESEKDNNEIEDLEITLPNMDTLNEEIKDVVNSDDVWKF